MAHKNLPWMDNPLSYSPCWLSVEVQGRLLMVLKIPSNQLCSVWGGTNPNFNPHLYPLPSGSSLGGLHE